MTLRISTFLAAICFAFAAQATDRDAAFRACVAETATASVTTTFHHCTGALAAPCGSEKTAADAVACIDEARATLETRIEIETRALAAREGESRKEVEWYLADSRGSGESSCAVMASQDAVAGVGSGQRAVNGAFCRLVVSGDAYALLLKLAASK